MNERYIQEVNVSRYPPQKKNKSGEIHEHWSFTKLHEKYAAARKFRDRKCLSCKRFSKQSAPI